MKKSVLILASFALLPKREQCMAATFKAFQKMNAALQQRLSKVANG